jgi:hypothetical protein
MRGNDPLLQKMDFNKVNIESPETATPLPAEPFACPECGQMLAAACRVCVACKKPVDLTRIASTPPAAQEEALELPRSIPLEPARFSWGIFFTVFFAYLFLASLSQSLMGFKASTYTMGGFVLATSLWVFVDAREKRIRKPAGWAIACLLLWLVFFPWYVSRRRTPEAPCPLIEGESGPVARVIILFLILITLVGAVMMISSGDFTLK